MAAAVIDDFNFYYLNGCAAVIQYDHPKAVYSHCSSHVLNLCVMATSKIALVSNMWTTLKETSLFLENSPKRQKQLESTVNNMPPETVDESRKKKLVSLCPMRWVLRHNAIVPFADLFPAVVATLEVICQQPCYLERRVLC